MTPAENKQTVEAHAAAFRDWAMAGDNRLSSWLITREEARAALVAQADRAAELEAALRDLRDGAQTWLAETSPGQRINTAKGRGMTRRAAEEADRVLAGDGGGA